SRSGSGSQRSCASRRWVCYLPPSAREDERSSLAYLRPLPRRGWLGARRLLRREPLRADEVQAAPDCLLRHPLGVPALVPWWLPPARFFSLLLAGLGTSPAYTLGEVAENKTRLSGGSPAQRLDQEIPGERPEPFVLPLKPLV